MFIELNIKTDNTERTEIWIKDSTISENEWYYEANTFGGKYMSGVIEHSNRNYKEIVKKVIEKVL